MNEFRHVGRHSEDLASGQMVAPGETVKLSDTDVNEPHNQRLIDEGILSPTKEPKGAKDDNKGGGDT